MTGRSTVILAAALVATVTTHAAAHRGPRTAGQAPQTGSSPPQRAPYRDTIPGTLVAFEMVPVPAGSLALGGPEGHQTVEVGPFWIGRTEVTWDEFDVFALQLDTPASRAGVDATARPSRPYGAPDRGFGHTGYPAISITRHAAEAYCAWLSAKTGRTYRLPTDAEWSRAATLALPARDVLDHARLDGLAWLRTNAGGATHPVASKEPDAIGLHDLLGNAAEWVVLADGSAVVRGGSYRDPPEHVRADARAPQTDSWNESDPQIPKSRWWLSDGPFVGFRIVRAP